MTLFFTILYSFTIISALIYFGHLIKVNFRAAILVSAIFSSLTMGALPWHFFPVNGIATALQLCCILLALLYFLTKSSKQPIGHFRYLMTPYVITLLLLWLIMIFYLAFSPALGYGLLKSIFFIHRVLLPILTLTLIAPFTLKDIQTIFYTLCVGSTLMTLSLWSVSSTNTLRAGFDNLYPITAARIVGLGFTLCLFVLFLHRFEHWHSRLKYICLTLLLSYGMILTGSRGPLLAALLAFLFSLLFIENRFARRLKGFIRLGLLATVIISFLVLSQVDLSRSGMASLNRLVYYTTNFGKTNSDLSRIDRASIAQESFIDTQGFGLGTGGFDPLYKSEGKTIAGIVEYPHNLFLEVASEQGILGLAVLIILLALTLSRAYLLSRNYSRDIYTKALLSIIPFAFFNSMLSADIVGNYQLWILSVIPWLIPLYAEETTVLSETSYA